jgi:uncharacterized membrane protein YhfC
MIFLILAAVSGVILIVAPVAVARMLKARWKMPDKMFFRAGLFLLVIEIFHMAVVGNGTSAFPQFFAMPTAVQALILGLLAGLFYELGRYVAMDRFFRNVRDRKEAIYFGLGFSGLETIMFGILLFIGTFAIYTLANTSDLAASFSTASPKDLEQLKAFQEQALQLVNGNPLLALAPVLERLSLGLIDIAMTLVMILCFQRGDTKYAWAAVAFRVLFVSSLYIVSNYNTAAGELVFAAFAAISFYIIQGTRKSA